MDVLKNLKIAGNYALYVASFALIGTSVLASWLILSPVTVLKNWHIDVNATEYTVGDTIYIDSHYDKLKPVVGHAHRYIECQDSHGAYIRYPLSEAVADHPPGKHTGTAAIATIPRVAFLPTYCHISISIEYSHIYGFRTVSEFQRSADFKVNP